MNFFKTAGVSLLWLLFLTSCSKKDHQPLTPAKPSILQYLQQDKSLSLFYAALQRTGLDSVIAGGGPYTVFAASDSAFLQAGLTRDRINTYDPASLKGLIGYQVVNGRISTDALVGFFSDSMTSLHPRYTPIITQNYYGTFFNGIQVVQANIQVADGVLHKIGKVAFPPSGNLLQLIDSLPGMTMASYLFHRIWALNMFADHPEVLIGPYNPPYTGVLGAVNKNSCTLVLPNDEAFKAYGIAGVDDLRQMQDSIALVQLVKAGVMYGTYFTADFLGGRLAGPAGAPYQAAPDKPFVNGFYQSSPPYPMNYGNNSSYAIGKDGVSLYGNGVLVPPHIVKANLMTTNGVLHVIDQVFVPQGAYTIGAR